MTRGVFFLSEHYRSLVDRYHGPEGDRLALEELTPVAARFVRPEGTARVLEVGCGYGRNLVALSALPRCAVVGCDVSRDELDRAARERLAPLPGERRARVALVRQEPYRLPFADSTFDLVVLWQVLEHVFGAEAKRRVLAECTRVLRPGGHLLVETPNQWFPVDYHDNKVPFAHWLLPVAARRWLTWKIRGQRYQPSEYLGVRGYERLIRSGAGVKRIARATRFYFAPGWRSAWRDLSGTQVALKRVILVAVLPLHALLSLFGSSGDLLLPSVRMVWRVDKSAADAA
jgi:SAM-dependent methyltransferase